MEWGAAEAQTVAIFEGLLRLERMVGMARGGLSACLQHVGGDCGAAFRGSPGPTGSGLTSSCVVLLVGATLPSADVMVSLLSSCADVAMAMRARRSTGCCGSWGALSPCRLSSEAPF